MTVTFSFVAVRLGVADRSTKATAGALEQAARDKVNGGRGRRGSRARPCSSTCCRRWPRAREQRRLRLIGDVAHELRNPLSTVQGTMEALLDGVLEADDDTFARIGREAARLRRLADDLSSLSAAGESGALTLGPVDLAAVLTEVVEQLRPQAAAKELALDLIPADLPPIRGDGDRLTQVVMNVVGNAVQYTDVGGVRVQARVEGVDVVIEVSDTGRGLAAGDLTRIFERFHRVDQYFADGTGVGLAIAKLIVEAHDGRITAASEGLGHGTTITIELPIGPA